MTAFLYWIPNQDGNELAKNDCEGLRRELPVLHDIKRIPQECVIRDVFKGIDGQRGYVYCPTIEGSEPPNAGYYPARQKWFPLPGGKAIGYEIDSPPTPEELQRTKSYPGYGFEDDYGRRWSVPIARSPQSHLGGLPSYITFGPSGKVERTLKPEYAHVWEIAGHVNTYFSVEESDWSDEDRERLTDEWLLNSAVDALSCNYRIGKPEINALHDAGLPMFDAEMVQRILLALIDFQTVVEYQKKTVNQEDSFKPADSLKSTTGDSADCQTTAPATVH